MRYDPNKRDNPGDFFPLPKAIFRLGLDAGEIAIYAYLMYCEDRKTFQCHPSYATIGEAVGMRILQSHLHQVRDGILISEEERNLRGYLFC